MKLFFSKKEINVIDKGFEISVILKGLDGLLEVLGGIFLIFVPITKINVWVYLLTKKELVEDPKDFIANHLVNYAHSLTVSTIDFAIIFLLIHGLVKVFLVVMLLKKKLWSYPLAIAIFSIFGVYQIYLIYLHGSISLILLTTLDVVVIILTYMEYKVLKKNEV